MLYTIPKLVYDAITESERSFVYGKDEGNIIEGITPVRTGGHRAWVSIMYGCNNFCSYCIVPYVRGRERSRASADVIRECEELVKNGCKEITLLGQNVNSYRTDVSFAGLLEKIAGIDGDFIIRFMTSHPKDASDELIEVMAKYTPKIAPYFHLPLQSGSDRILSLMNRRYTRERFLSVARQLKEKIPGIAISTDIIVGFPSETDSDFEDTVSILKEVKFDLIYAFIYSPREGTPAAKMDGQIPHNVSTERMSRLLKLQDEICLERNSRFVGETISVLCEGVSKNDPEMMTGRADVPRPVHFKGDPSMEGKILKVKITWADKYSLRGELV